MISLGLLALNGYRSGVIDILIGSVRHIGWRIVERQAIWREAMVNVLCRNLPFGGRATRDSRVRLPRKEYARSRHQRLFEENVGKTKKRRDLQT